MSRNYFRRAAEYDIPADNTEGPRSQCRHIHTGGNRCASPSLRNQKFCYYHHGNRYTTSRAGMRRREKDDSIFTLALPDERGSIQHSIGQILQMVACNDIDIKRATTILWGLQIASHNLPKESSSRKDSVMLVPTVDEVVDDEVDGLIAPESEWTPDADLRDPFAELEAKLNARAAREDALAAAKRIESGTADLPA